MNLKGKDLKRYWARVERSGPTECWNWISKGKSVTNPLFIIDGTAISARRIMVDCFDVPGRFGSRIFMSCDNKQCVNPNHMGNSYQQAKRPTNRKPKPIEEKLMEKVDKQDNGCWVWTGITMGTAASPLISHNNQMVSARRAMCEVMGTPVPPRKRAFVACGTKSCVNPVHIVTSTQSDNTLDAKPQRSRGSGARYLTPSDVREIRHLDETTNLRQSDIANRFGVTQSAISSIVTHRTWRNIDSIDVDEVISDVEQVERKPGGKGESNVGAKLNNAKVMDIRKRYPKMKKDNRLNDLASEYNVTRQTLNDIAARRSWAHV